MRRIKMAGVFFSCFAIQNLKPELIWKNRQETSSVLSFGDMRGNDRMMQMFHETTPAKYGYCPGFWSRIVYESYNGS